jgi:preprotein translocase subunit SecY
VFDRIANVFRIPDLRRRLYFTALMLVIYRIGSFIPVPGVDPDALAEYMGDIGEGAAGSVLDFADMFTGGALSQMAVFAMGIMPYISASIILQLLTVVVPTLERLSKEGEMGRRKITQYTRYLTGVLAAIQGFGIAVFLTSASAVTVAGRPLVPLDGSADRVAFFAMTVLTLTTGTVFIMWLGEQISERGIGNGISLLIFAGIVVRMPAAVKQTVDRVTSNRLNLIEVAVLVIMFVATVAFIVFVERAQRRIPVQYAKRVVGRRLAAGGTTHLPLKLNTAGVIPVIFAQSVIILPGLLVSLPAFREVGWVQGLAAQLGYAMPLYTFLYVVAIVFFCFFYTSIVFNPVDTTDNIKKYGGFIPGIRPGKKTAEYIDTVLTRLTFWGALYLSLVSLLPMFVTSGVRLHELPAFLGGAVFEGMPRWFKTGLDLPQSAQSFFGGTSLLIVVGVAMDFANQVESQLIMRNYDGFLRSTRIRGRRG